jgi:DNA repair exonuclease SbcCD ATPase subunit
MLALEPSTAKIQFCMWIERLDIAGFRRVAGTFAFSPHLTLVVGDNEAGKSSLHEALIRALFGFSKPERRRFRGRAVIARFAPWQGGAYGVVALVKNKDGRSTRIEWDFDRHRVKVIDEFGRDVSDEVRGRNEDVTLGEYLTGVNLDDFRQVCCIDQADLAAVRHSPSLGVALQDAVANVGKDTPVEEAIERLNEFLRTSIGARVDNLKPSPTGTLNALIRRRDALEASLSAADEQREQLVGLAREHAKTREKYNAVSRARDRARQRLLLTDLRELESRLGEASRLEQHAGQVSEIGVELSDVMVSDVTTTRVQLEELATKVDGVVRALDAGAARLADLEEQERLLTTALDGLAPYAGVNPSAQTTVASAWASLKELRKRSPADVPSIPQRDSLLAQYRIERNDLMRLAAEPRRSNLRRALWIVLVVGSLSLAVLVRKLVRRVLGARPPQELADRLAFFGASSLEELDERATNEDLEIAKAEAVASAFRERLADDAARVHELEAEIEHALDSAAAPSAATLEQRVIAYLTATERYGDRREAEAKLERARRELEEARRPVRDRRRLQEERQTLERRLRRQYGSVGIESDDLVAAGDAFDELVRLNVAHRAHLQEASSAGAALRSLLGDDTTVSLSRRVEEARQLYRDHVHRVGEFADEPGSAEQLKVELSQLDAETGEVERALTILETQIEALEANAAGPAELKEQVAKTEERLIRLEEAKEAIGIARDVLGASADELKRQFAPHLNEALRAKLPRVTDGRYSQAMVDGELGVSVVAPETGLLVSADDLSRATRDQIFLVQRLEIARLLAPTKGPAPLLLDDPFAHYDSRRLRQGLELIREAADERQIILFSEDRGLLEIADALESGCEVIELPSARNGS